MATRERSVFQKRGRKAFSLVEVLVVAAILGLLAAILTPVFARAREQAKVSVSISNVHQQYRAFLLYTADNDERWPRVVHAVTLAGLARGDLPGERPSSDFAYVVGQKTVQEVLDPYLKIRDIWRSPNDRITPGLYSTPMTDWEYSGSSYTYLVEELCSGTWSQLREPSLSGVFRESGPYVRKSAVLGRADGSVAFLDWMAGSEQLERTEVDFGCR